MVHLARLQTIGFLPLLVLVVGCTPTDGFRFPVQEGDVGAGRQVFVDQQCHQCHSVAGVRIPALAGGYSVLLELGGEAAAAKSYGELMTSVINPNHAISERYREQLRLQGAVPLDSPMPMPQTDTITVRELIDLVAFLDSRYVYTEGYGAY